MKNYIPTLLCDFYKVSHREQYPVGTEEVYSTWTARGSRIKGIDEVVAFGFQYFIKNYLIDYFNENFFNRNIIEITDEYVRYMKYTLGIEKPSATHLIKLHQLGYLPLEIKAVAEGTLVPLRVPMLTIRNTVPEFYWLTNYIETLFSAESWLPITSATIAREYRRILDMFAEETSDIPEAVMFQGHDFSMRGMTSLESAARSGAAHLLSFVGTDTIPAIMFLERFYGADIEKELVGTSIPATEHSVMCAYGKDTEFETYKRLITEVYPNGFLSIVSDTWDLWKVLTDVIKPLKDEINARDGRIVIRPDSGDPELIVCGNPKGKTEEERKGVIQILWEIFGGEVNSKGYKQLNPKIGAIYGDAITMERAWAICKNLQEQGFASTNVVFGIGSYTYQYNTRDTFGFAIKSTFCRVNGEDRMIFKDPVTDDGLKKSQKGKVELYEVLGKLRCVDNLTSEPHEGLMKVIFKDGKLYNEQTLAQIRAKLAEQ